MNKLAINEVDNNRDVIKDSFQDANQYKLGYVLPESIFVKMKNMAIDDGIEWNKEQFELSERLMSVQLKALMARDLYDQSAYYMIINDINEVFQEGLRVISSPSEYSKLLSRN